MKVFCQIDVQFKHDEYKFEDIFLLLPLMNRVVSGNPFFVKYSDEIRLGDNILKLPEKTQKLNETKTPNDGRKMTPEHFYTVQISQKNITKPQH